MLIVNQSFLERVLSLANNILILKKKNIKAINEIQNAGVKYLAHNQF